MELFVLNGSLDLAEIAAPETRAPDRLAQERIARKDDRLSDDLPRKTDAPGAVSRRLEGWEK
jgi:hypothetical protein